MNGIGGHTRAYRGSTDEWLTPPWILNALGSFDLDPAAPAVRPWEIARQHFSVKENGLIQSWAGRVFLNPPYGPETSRWLERLVRHGRGTALTFARTETRMFFSSVWPCASALLFLRGRPHFHLPDGTRAKGNSGGPVVLIAYGDEDATLLRDSGLDGAFIGLHGKRCSL